MPPPPPPPPSFCLPGFQRRKLITQHPNASGSTATLTSLTSTATKLQFTEDTESYAVTVPERKPSLLRHQTSPRLSSPTPSERKPASPLRKWSFGKRWDEGSVSTLVTTDDDIPNWKVQDPSTVEEKVDTTPRLQALRRKMAEEQIDYFIIPTQDGHMSEYVAPSEQRRKWISGFTGSAGTAVISKHSAYLFTDSRYWLQAAREIDSNWQLMRVGSGPGHTKDWLEWVILCPRGSKIGIDSRTIPHDRATRLFKALYDRGSKLVHPRQNLVDLVWEGRPKRSKDPVFQQPIQFCGKEAKEKLSEVRRYIRQQNSLLAATHAKEALKRRISAQSASASNVKPAAMQRTDTSGTKYSDKTLVDSSASSQPYSPAPLPTPNENISAMFISSLANVAHLLNLRGTDVPFNPVFTAYLLVALDKTVLFIDAEKLPKEIQSYLHGSGVSIRDYNEVWTYLRDKTWGEGKIIIDPSTPYAVSLIVGSQRYLVLPSFVDQQKAIKNEVEISGFRSAYLRDGAAFVKWFAWLDHMFRNGYAISEWEAGEKINEIRSKLPLHVGPSYENISASGPNAALPHYSPSKNQCALIDRQTPYLIDSGAQYRDGTTDTTRTVHFGSPTTEQSEAFTRVLQGHIAIDTAVFPAGTAGSQLDVLARKALWKDGLDYGHGTGHGFGSFLNVHEGPQSFGSGVPLELGHVLTNEPGYYKENAWGIRIESALAVTPVEMENGANFYKFERFTQVPIQIKMIKSSLLSKAEREWVRDHNLSVKRALEPLLQDDKRALKWLRRECTVGFRSEGFGGGGFSIEWD